MTRKEQKTFNAENYPASVLEWLNRETDKIFDYYEKREEEMKMVVDELMFKVDSKQMDIINHFNSRTCNNCKHYVRLQKNCNHMENEQSGDWICKMQVHCNFGCNKWESK